MLKVYTPIVRETLARDPESGKAIVIKLDPPGLTLGLRAKQSKQTYSISILDVYMAAKQARGEDFKVLAQKTAQKVKQEPDISEVIRHILEEKDSLHFSQLRSQLKKRGIDVSRRVTGSILRLMTQTHQVQHDERMYYSLAKVS